MPVEKDIGYWFGLWMSVKLFLMFEFGSSFQIMREYYQESQIVGGKEVYIENSPKLRCNTARWMICNKTYLPIYGILNP